MPSFAQSIRNLFFVPETRNATSGLENPAEWLYTLLGGSKTSAGVNVNPETALSHAAVYACLKVLAESVASLPLELFLSSENSTKPLTSDARYNLVNSEPSELYTSYSFRVAGMMHLGLQGNFYADIIRDGNRRATGFKIIDPTHVAPGLDPEGNLWYKIHGRSLPVRPRDIIHIKGLSSDGLIGRSPIQLFKETIGLGIATTETQGALWKNGMLTMGYLKHPAKMTADQVADIKDNFKINHAGRGNAGKMPVLQGGMEYVPLTLKPSDAMFIETAKLSRQDICSIYRVPPHMIGDLERSTNNNIEHQSLEFVRDTLRPILKNWEQELNRKLLFDTEKSTKFFRFNVDALLRGDTKSRAEYFARALGSVSAPGWMAPNEVRAIENMNPVDGGDTLYSPSMNNATDPAEISDTGAQNTDTNGEEETGAAA